MREYGRHTQYFICSCPEMWRTPRGVRCSDCGDDSASARRRGRQRAAMREMDRRLYSILSRGIIDIKKH